jgi:hypothetical protein
MRVQAAAGESSEDVLLGRVKVEDRPWACLCALPPESPGKSYELVAFSDVRGFHKRVPTGRGDWPVPGTT